MQFVTDFGDQAVTLPLAVCIGLALAIGGWRRGALAWAAGSGACWASILAMKVVFEACGPMPGPGVLASPSGHAASAVFVYAGLAALTAGPRAAFPAAALVALVIGGSRVALGAHSLPDVVVGSLTGAFCLWITLRLCGPRPEQAPLRGPAAALVAAPLLLHGSHLEAEEGIQYLAAGWPVWPLTLCGPRQLR